MRRTCRLLLCFLIALPSQAISAEKHASRTLIQVQPTTRTLDINRHILSVTDRGNLVTNLSSSSGGEWWYTATHWGNVVFDHGPWIIGKTPEGLAMGNTYWGTSYVPGPIVNGRPALDVNPQDSLRFHPYKISRSTTPFDSDLVAWPVDLGAPATPDRKPLLLGDELIWTVFNGADSTARPDDWQASAKFNHMPVEIHQSVYARAGSTSDTSLLANTAFIEWTFINKGTAAVESCYVGLWTDIDFFYLNTPFGVDTALQTGYCWQAAAFDTAFSPKAAGYTLLYGPRVPDENGSALFLGKRISGYRNLPLSSFWGMRNDFGPPGYFPVGPNTVNEAWNIARGYDKAGQVIIDSVTKLPTRFPWSGDPVTGTGWVYRGSTEFEGGFLFFTGPFTFAPGDTQWTMISYLPAASTSPFEAIRAVRAGAARLRALSYDDLVSPRTLSVEAETVLPRTPTLYQNFPNPFNPTTVISFQLPVASSVRLVVFDVLGREVATLVNERETAGPHEVRFNAGNLASGVYFYRLFASPQSGRTLAPGLEAGEAGDYSLTRKLLLLR